MSSVKTDKRKNSKSDSALLSHTIDIFTFLILCLFPLFVMDRYYNILQAKYYFILDRWSFWWWLLFLPVV